LFVVAYFSNAIVLMWKKIGKKNLSLGKQKFFDLLTFAIVGDFRLIKNTLFRVGVSLATVCKKLRELRQQFICPDFRFEQKIHRR